MEEEEELDTSAAKLLVLTLGSKAEVCSLDLGPLLLGMWGMVCSGYRMLVEMSWMLPSLLMGQHSPQPVGMARSSSSKYISMRRVLQVVSTSEVFMEESLSPVSSSWMTTAPTSLMYSTGSMRSLAAASTQSSRFGPVRAGPACRPSPSTGWGRTWGSGSRLTWTPLPGTWWLTSAWFSS